VVDRWLPRPVGSSYEIVDEISSGAMGAVYRARDARTGRDVALKRLLDPRHGARFEIEAELLARLRHPRVVRVLDAFSAGADRYLVMELVEGPTLADVLREEGAPGLPVDDVVAWIGQVCEALQYVHDEHLVHRDVKPPNVVLGEGGAVLVDFGIARDLERPGTATAGIGTPRYVAPEVLAGAAPSPRSDVFGAAATMWTLLTGAPPVYGTQPDAIVDGLPSRVTAALRAGLELDPARRAPSAAAFARSIGAPFRAGGGSPLALSAPEATRPRSLLEEIVKATAGVFGAAAASIALLDAATGGLLYEAAWGAGAERIVGVRLAPGEGIAGAVVRSGAPVAIAECRTHPQFAAGVAAGTGHVPHTMVAVPLRAGSRVIGVLAVLDRRDGRPFDPSDADRAEHLAVLAVAALEDRAARTMTDDPAVGYG